jgi:ABC-type multidrug transport system fused ATPase/permease subunit
VLDADDAIEESGTIGTENLRGEFELKNVNFTYPNGMQALVDVSMKIPHGKTVAFVGLSGAGKSTLLNLLCKFYAPTNGEILLDGKNLLDFQTNALRRKIGLVLQKANCTAFTTKSTRR